MRWIACSKPRAGARPNRSDAFTRARQFADGGARNRVSAGNYLTAKPMGIVDGVDMQLTGEVRRIDTEAIQQRLDDGDIVLISPLGYSPTGEIFNLTVEEVATQVAVRMNAQKLVFLMETDGVRNGRRQLLSDLSTREAEALLKKPNKLAPDVRLFLPAAIRACDNGVKRAHLISRHQDGALLLEFFTRDGVGTMLAATALAHIRSATIDDVGGIISIIEPLEETGVLVRRSRERWRAKSSASLSPNTTTTSSVVPHSMRLPKSASASLPRSPFIPISSAKVTAKR
jgi:amino-acid N-acetyltransferase